MVKLSARNQTSEYIRELTLERNPTNVINVEKLSVKNQALENIRKPIQGNKNINIFTVGLGIVLLVLGTWFTYWFGKKTEGME